MIVGRVKRSSGSDFDSDSYPQPPVSVRGKSGVAPGSLSLSNERDAQMACGKVKRVNYHQFTKVKLEKKDIVATKRKSCCKNCCLQLLGACGIRLACKKYFRLKSQDRPLSLQWLIGKGKT